MKDDGIVAGTEGGLRFEILLLTPRYQGSLASVAARGRSATSGFPTRAEMNSALRPGPRTLCIECMRRLRNGRNGRGRQ